MSEVTLTPSGPPETVIADGARRGARGAGRAPWPLDGDERRAAIAAVVAGCAPLAGGWARLGDAGRDVIEAYAAYRVGYHRGLDTPARQRLAGERLRALGAPRRTAGSCGRWPACSAPPRRSARTTRPSAAPTSCASSTRLALLNSLKST